ncbi:MAG: propanoyl-CoA acyltransferase [Candidatus Riflebacteria bacterium]|nr:propanoyl-CoA acyltransferase [Candidatus Riflebacteria bacterium]
MSKVSIIGAYNTKFGALIEVKDMISFKKKIDTNSYYDLIIEAGRGAIKDSGLEAKDIDAVWIGSCSPSRFVNQEHVAPLAVAIDPALRFKPMTRTECACASSSVAIYDATYAVESGRFKNVLVIGVEKMNLLDTPSMTATLATCSYYPEEGGKGATFPSLFAELAKSYSEHYNLSENEFRTQLAHVAALGYRNAASNPLAHVQNGPATAEEILALPETGRGSNMMIAAPLRLHDCSLVSDGAAAVVITSTENAKATRQKVVEIAGIGHSVEYLPMSRRPKKYALEAGRDAVGKAFREAGITAANVDIAEVHDCFTINQLLTTEAMGLSAEGRAGYDYASGRFTADDPNVCVNLSGGLKAKGHPVGATGASMHALIYKQLMGEPIGMAPKRKTPGIGVTFNVGGSAVTNCVTVLRRIK